MGTRATTAMAAAIMTMMAAAAAVVEVSLNINAKQPTFRVHERERSLLSSSVHISLHILAVRKLHSLRN